MKNIYPLLLAGLLTCGMGACNQGNKESLQEDTEEAEELDEWKEFDAFHMVMAEVFHPLKDSGNLQPAMERMEELAREAEKWSLAPLPTKADNEEMKAKIEKLKVEARALADAVKNGAPEDQVGTALYHLHDLFHEIQEDWLKEPRHEH